MKRRHKMPFGAECSEDGSVRFRLWAPAARRVELSLAGAKRSTHIPLQEQTKGWFELVTDAARHGTQYRFRIDGEQEVPDPASRFQPRDVHGPSEVIDPESFEWRDDGWRGRPWEEAVIYELHVGTFTPSGKFSSVRTRLEYLAELGITAIELMPVADFPGKRNWGYDGVLPFAPDSSYGRPDDLKRLIDTCHARGICVLLDVVYNHFGPEGNYLHLYAPDFFTERSRTPWGAAINFACPHVRRFYVENALYWLEEYHFDGLRFDAVHAIADDGPRHILTEIAETVRQRCNGKRRIHLVLENDNNEARRLGAGLFNAQWNDDVHHAL